MRLRAAVGCLVLGLAACGTGTQTEQERQTQNSTLKAGDAGTQPGTGSGHGNGGPNGGGVDCFALKEALASCIAQNWGKSCDAIVADLQKCQPPAPPACDGPWPVDPNGGTKPGDPNGGGTKPGDPNGGGTKPGDPNGGGTKPGDPNAPVTDPAGAGNANGGGSPQKDPNLPVTDPNGSKPVDPNGWVPPAPDGKPPYPVDPGCVPPPLDPCIALKNLHAQCIQTLPTNPICSQILAAGLQQCGGGGTSPNGPTQPPVPDGPKK